MSNISCSCFAITFHLQNSTFFPPMDSCTTNNYNHTLHLNGVCSISQLSKKPKLSSSSSQPSFITPTKIMISSDLSPRPFRYPVSTTKVLAVIPPLSSRPNIPPTSTTYAQHCRLLSIHMN
ncbi:hypothetical protein AAHE18_04G064200 [Arachis hypogaea]